MAKYLIDVQKEDIPPTYLTAGHKTPTLQDVRLGIAQDEQAARGPVKIVVEGTKGRHSLAILQKDTWPTAQQLGLDNSQYHALQAALTREMVVIQGPPGTGKTFMALKIAEILIKNKQEMGRTTPILVVCLTNHALDQFLVGMLKFTKKLVRIGGQSKCEELDEFNLKRTRVPRSRQQYQLQDALVLIYRELATVEHRLRELNLGLQRTGVLINPKFQGGNLPKRWMLGESMSNVLEWLNNEDEVTKNFISFEEMRNFVSHLKGVDIRALNLNQNIGEEEAAYWRFEIDQHYSYLETEIVYLENQICNFERKPGKSASVSQMQHLHKLSLEQKMQLYTDLLETEKASLDKQQQELVNKVHDYRQRLDELKSMEHIAHLREQDVIGLTTNGAARLHTMLKAMGCEIGILFANLKKNITKSKFLVIVEEAAEVMESHIVACVGNKCKHLILIGNKIWEFSYRDCGKQIIAIQPRIFISICSISFENLYTSIFINVFFIAGDHKQLRPTIAVYELGKIYNFDVSLFERMVINREGCITLQVQHRMCPEMAQLIVPTIYKTLENHESVLDRACVRSLRKRLFFKTHSELEQQVKSIQEIMT